MRLSAFPKAIETGLAPSATLCDGAAAQELAEAARLDGSQRPDPAGIRVRRPQITALTHPPLDARLSLERLYRRLTNLAHCCTFITRWDASQ